MNVIFNNVGREKKTWVARCEGEVTYDWMYRQVKKHGMVMSRDIDFTDSGKILAGMRPIGEYNIDHEEGTNHA